MKRSPDGRSAHPGRDRAPGRKELAPTGTLRAGINLSNYLLVTGKSLLFGVFIIGGFLRTLFGHLFGAGIASAIVGGALWLIIGSILFAGAGALIAFIFVLLGGGGGGFGGWGGGGGWSSGGGGFSGGGFSGGGGMGGGGGASGSW